MPSSTARTTAKIRDLALELFRHYGAQNWWPAETPFEVVVGAILVQRTAWRNAELGIRNLRDAKVLSVDGLRGLSRAELERLIRPSGFYRQKAERLKAFVAFLDDKHQGNLDSLLRLPLADARAQLLSLKGIGPETADTIVLYAGGHPVFIVDTYARRLFTRTKTLPNASTLPYGAVQQRVENALLECPFPRFHSRTPNHPASVMSSRDISPQARLLAEFHACIVRAEIEALRLPITSS